MKFKILFVFSMFMMLFFFCRKQDEEIIPESGEWMGENISFYVSSDGTEFTTTGSTLEEGAALIVTIPVNQNPYGVASITFYKYEDIPISDGEFAYDDERIDVEGTFSSPTSASGTASCSAYSSSFGYTFTGSCSWAANYQISAPDVDHEARDNGVTLHLSWTHVSDADGYYIYADGQRIDSTENNTYDATIPAAIYKVSAYAGDMESERVVIDCTPVTSSNITVWGNSDPSPVHPSGIGFTGSGNCISLSVGDETNWPDIDYYFDDTYFDTITLVSPNEHEPPYNNENNSATNSGLVNFADLEIADPPGQHVTEATLLAGYVYSLWMDPDHDGWDAIDDHFGKMKVATITGSTAPYKVEITVAYQLIPGLRWLVTN